MCLWKSSLTLVDFWLLPNHCLGRKPRGERWNAIKSSLSLNEPTNSSLYFTSSSLLIFFFFFPISKMNPNMSNTKSTPPEGKWSTGICGCFEDVTNCKGILNPLFFFFLIKKKKNFKQKYIV